MKTILILLLVFSYTTQAQTQKTTPPKQRNPKDVPTETVKGKNTSAIENETSNIVIEPEPEEDIIFVSFQEKMPRFPGCEDSLGTDREKKSCSDQKLLAYIYENLEYPKDSDFVEGMAVVSFKIRANGNLDDIKVIRSLGAATDTQVMKLMNKMVKEIGPWIPGEQRGRPVDVRYNLPIRFKL